MAVPAREQPTATMRCKDSYTGIVVLVMFLICAPTLKVVFSFVAGFVTYLLIPVAILCKIVDVYVLPVEPLNRLASSLLDIVSIGSLHVYLTPTSDDRENSRKTPGPFELPDNNSDTMSTPSPVYIPSRGPPSPLTDGSYDRLSDISPHSSPTLPHSAKWSAGSRSSISISISDGYTFIPPPPPPPQEYSTIRYKANKTEHGNSRPSIKRASRIPSPTARKFPRTTQPTEMILEPNSATAPQPVETMPWNRNSFSNPAIQEKLRQQSILYHQIHGLLDENLGIRNKSVVEANAGRYKPVPDENRRTPPPSPIAEPTYKIEGVDHAKIKALKDKYPNKKALHNHLDKFSAIMNRFMALNTPDIPSLDLISPTREDRVGRQQDRPRSMTDSPTLPKMNGSLADIPEEQLVDGVF